MNPIGLLIVAFGVITIAGGYFNWNYFMTHRKAWLVVKILGRTGARVFYVLLGIVVLGWGLLITAGVLRVRS